MADQWYYSQVGNRIGPVSSRELRDRADEGKIQHSDTIWKEGTDQGMLANRVKNLFPPPPAGPPAASAVAPDTVVPAIVPLAVTA